MNSGYWPLSLPGPSGQTGPFAERPSMLGTISIACREFRRYMVPLATIFAVVALAVLVLGMLVPPTYKSSARVLVQDHEIISPLNEGRPATTDDASHAVFARNILFGRGVMEEILRAGGWLDAHPSPIEKEKLIKTIISSTDIAVSDSSANRSTDPSLSLIDITYADSDSKRAYAVAKRFSEELIAQTAAAKARGSRTTYEMLDAQVKKYQRDLADADGNLEAYRRANPDADPGVGGDVAARIGELRRTIDGARIDLVEQGSQERQLLGQISRESEVSTVSRSTQFNAQLAALQADEDRLKRTYTDRHPDVVSIREQIRDLQGARRSGAGRGAASFLPGATPSLNPLYGQLRAQLSEVRRQSAAAASRLATAQALLADELSRNQNIMGSESTVAELTRAHDVNRELYEGLLKQRETARVSMTLDAEGRGLGFQIQEPASIPLIPTGLRLMHFAIAGLVLATLVPLLLVSLRIKQDPRVRSTLQIEREAGLPVLGAIPMYVTHEMQAQDARMRRKAAAVALTVPVVYGVVLLLKLANVL